MKLNRDISIILSEEDGPAIRLAELIQGLGGSCRIAATFDEGIGLLREYTRGFLLFEAGREKSKIDSSLEKLLNNPHFFAVPTIFIAPDANQYLSTLRERLYSCITLSTPYDANSLAGAFRHLETNLRPVPICAPPPESPPPVTQESQDEDLPWPHELYEQHTSVLDLFFSMGKKFELHKRDLGGRHYAKAVRERLITYHEYLPKDGEVLSFTTDFMEQLGQSSRIYVHRLAMANHLILSSVDTLSPGIREIAKEAGLAYSIGVRQERQKLFQSDYSTDRDLRRYVSLGLKQSAEILGEKLKAEEASIIVATAARLLNFEEAVTDQEHSLAASSLLASDLIERYCWRMGMWSATGCRRLLSKCRSGQFKEIHPLILCCMMKLVMEAGVAHVKGKQTAKEDKGDNQLHERQVHISCLTPGMRLSRPLYAVDGRSILSDDLVLDQDSIWRLWRLSSVRALGSPHVFTWSEEEQDEQQLSEEELAMAQFQENESISSISSRDE